MELTFQVPTHYCSYSIELYFHHQSHPQLCVVFALTPSLHSFETISPPFSRSIFTTRHIHNWVLFLLWFSLFIPSRAISLLFSSSILGTCLPWEFIFQCHIFLPFHTSHDILKARMLKWFPIPFSSGLCFVRTFTMTRPSWVALHGTAHPFIKLDKAGVLVISLISFLWLWFPFCLPSCSDGWGHAQ